MKTGKVYLPTDDDLRRFGIFAFPNYNVIIKMIIYKLGGGNSHIFGIFIPKIGEDEPILTSIFFRWVGEKPPTRKKKLEDDFVLPPRHSMNGIFTYMQNH